mmetsp:Transcript_15471/g.27783  ORF Transcript_15471/g.27783 Transcript_15471/m.27783 type:complete len:148 (-) Transcript_15471:118-561(-)|eukprot:CAMPEP_0197528026 /NCGR_PEP_ID=MMETSP1318-20131121/23596_1 /TAXON_ID=552666 /ORGANISM="Partenskyella glossopodia, Strain RCC365" /LENGTH=147 /DNA_ID=CAMNT_0043082927 /DNA_START=253 /DNA_END=696 /DNA_ORIENTATION=-
MSNPNNQLATIYDDDPLQESDVSDDEQAPEIVPGSFVDYLYLRYGPMLFDFIDDVWPYAKVVTDTGKTFGGAALRFSWKATTSFIIYALPLLIAMEKNQKWEEQKKQSTAPPDTTNTSAAPAPTTEGPPAPSPSSELTMLPPPSVSS